MPSIADALPLDLLRAEQKGPYVMLARQGWADTDYLRLMLNEHLEGRIAEILHADDVGATIRAWAAAMAAAIPGYGTWEEIREYIWDSLRAVEQGPDIPEGMQRETLLLERLGQEGLLTSGDLVEYNLEGAEVERQKLHDENYNPVLARIRIAVLDRARRNLPKALRPLFRQVYYTYKLREALFGQLGYYNGSIELRLGLTDDFEFNMYLIQMKLRHPERQHLYKAPKAMRAYTTQYGSLLPWNNQFSFSFGFNEFGVGEMPLAAVLRIERTLIENGLFDPVRWPKLKELMAWSPADLPAVEAEHAALQEIVEVLRSRPTGLVDASLSSMGAERLSLPALVAQLRGDETRIKALFTLVLGLTWSSEPMGPHNPFAGLQGEQAARAHALVFDAVKSVNVAPADSPIEALQAARTLPNVVGRKANVLLTPASAIGQLEKKLRELDPEDLQDLYGAIEELTGETVTVERVIQQAQAAAEAWFASAERARKPIYTGPSGHALTYINLYLSAIAPDWPAVASPFPNGGPNLAQARLVLLAALVGFNQHHSYDEVMTASHRITFGDQQLRYEDRDGYKDLLGEPLIAEQVRQAAQAIAHDTIVRARGAYGTQSQDAALVRDVVKAWIETAVGEAYQPPA